MTIMLNFLRYGQHFIEKNGSGILAFINPHGFLDNPTFRGMRWNLLKTYDKIYTIDLHGNSKKKRLLQMDRLMLMFLTSNKVLQLIFLLKQERKIQMN